MPNDDGFRWYSGHEDVYLNDLDETRLRARLAEIAKRKAIVDHCASDVWPEDAPDIWKRLGMEKPHEE